MKTYIVKTSNMTDKIQLELMKYANGCVGELSRLGNLYIFDATIENIENVKLLPFVEVIEEDEVLNSFKESSARLSKQFNFSDEEINKAIKEVRKEH